MIDLNGIKAERFWLAAGAGGYGEFWFYERPFIKIKIPGYGRLIDPQQFTIVTKTLTLNPEIGIYINPFQLERRSVLSHLWHLSESKKVLRKISDGWINHVGLVNVGIDYFQKEIYPRVSHLNLVISIFGSNQYEFLRLIEMVNALKVAGIELNISCPNVEADFLRDLSKLDHLFYQARKESQHPLIVKIGSDTFYLEVAQLAEYQGINAISAINSVPGMLRFKEGLFQGGISGPRIKPQALDVIYQLKKKVKIPVIGGGGIDSWKDCQEFFEVGVDAVAFGSIHFPEFFPPWKLLNPLKPTWIVKRHSK